MEQHAGQRAAGDPAQRWPSHGRNRPGRRSRQPGQDGDGGAGAPHGQVLDAGAGAAGVYPQGQWKAEATRNTCDPGPLPSGAGQERAGARVEARFEPRSYGFRPGRCCQDAAESLYATLKGKSKRTWILDADLTAAFDKIDHSFLLSQLGTFPARDMIAAWLKAGVFEAGKGFAPTEEGTPQGGVISPLLLNVALHGLEEAAGVRYQDGDATLVEKDSPALVRYADLCRGRHKS